MVTYSLYQKLEFHVLINLYERDSISSESKEKGK